MRNQAVRIVGKVALTGVVLWSARKLEGGGHEKMAQFLRYTTASVYMGAAGWNVSLTVKR